MTTAPLAAVEEATDEVALTVDETATFSKKDQPGHPRRVEVAEVVGLEVVLGVELLGAAVVLGATLVLVAKVVDGAAELLGVALVLGAALVEWVDGAGALVEDDEEEVVEVALVLVEVVEAALVLVEAAAVVEDTTADAEAAEVTAAEPVPQRYRVKSTLSGHWICIPDGVSGVAYWK